MPPRECRLTAMVRGETNKAITLYSIDDKRKKIILENTKSH